MIPCKFCGFSFENNDPRRGLKQVGKTRHLGFEFQRTYRCLDCGASLSRRVT
jgi:rubredoxin